MFKNYLNQTLFKKTKLFLTKHLSNCSFRTKPSLHMT